MSEMIERVAKAIHEAMDITDALDGTAAERYARAAIEAMREPTEAMAERGAIIDRHVWSRMIDASLTPSDTSPPSSLEPLKSSAS